MAAKNNPICEDVSRETVAAYFESELTPADELRIEKHLALCSICAGYLNSLKLVSTSLEILLDNEPVSIPPKFTKTVKAAAESSVEDVRTKKERSRGLFVAALLFCLTAVLVSFSFSAARPAFADFAEQIFAFGGFIGHIFYNITVGFSVVVGGVCSSLLFGSVAAVAVIVTILITSVYIFSKHMTRLNRS